MSIDHKSQGQVGIPQVQRHITSETIAIKHGGEIPPQIRAAYDSVNRQVEILNSIDAPLIHKKAKLASIAKTQYKIATDAATSFVATIGSKIEEHDRKLEAAAKPNDAADSIMVSTLMGALINSGKEAAPGLARSDSRMAKAACNIPPALAKSIGVDSSSPLIHDQLVDGYTAERARLVTLLDAGVAQHDNIQAVLKPLYNSSEAQRAISDSAALRV